MSPNRFLRDPDLRAALYYDAEGKCQNCGTELDDSWHADHVVPWSVSGRTNVFEMEALCAKCNTKKGAHMQFEIPLFDLDFGMMRPGQRGAFNAITTRRRNNEQFTSVVLPTRYGKSDVARLSALQMMNDGLVSNALIIVPARNLVEQMLDDTKLRESASRYGIPAMSFYGSRTIDRPPKLTVMKKAKLLAMTTQMANEHLRTLTMWVDSMINNPKGPQLPPVVFMDEAHLASDGNKWGNITKTLSDAGAYVVVMTATPFRSDGRPIPGFEAYREVVSTTTRGAERVVYELEPHWETTLADAMDENPPPLAEITYQPFGIKGKLTDDFAGIVEEGVLLDDQNERVIRRAYREVLRDKDIIEDALRYFLIELSNRRGEPRQSGASGIIYVGNHEEQFERAENAHADRVKSLIKRLSPTLRCEIIVSSDQRAQTLLDEFIDGKVDVAIVKQMGAIGLDVPHLKVALDLSNTRTMAYFIQRMMRVATRWDVPGYPDNPVVTCTYIAPNDWLTRNCVVNALKGTGILKILDEGPGPEPGPIDVPSIAPPVPLFTGEKVVLTGNLLDADGVTAPVTYLNPVDNFRRTFPTASDLPKAKLTNWLVDAGVRPDAFTGRPPDEDGSDKEGVTAEGDFHEPPPILNLTKALNESRAKVSSAGRKAINARFKIAYGNYKTHRSEYPKVAARFWFDQFALVGLQRPGTKLEEIDDLDTLEAIYQNIKSELNGRRP